MLRYLCLAACLLAVLAVRPSGAEESKQSEKGKWDTSQLLGQWTYFLGKRAGETLDKERLTGVVTIAKDTVKVPGGPDGDFVMKYKIDAAATPVKIDLEIAEGPIEEGKALGILRMDNKDEITFCYDPSGRKRPEKFDSTSEGGEFLFVLKRKTS